MLVDLDQGVVRLEVGETKNDDGRTVYLDPDLREVFKDQHDQRGKIMSRHVFPNSQGGKLTDIRKSWNAACRKSGVGYGY